MIRPGQEAAKRVEFWRQGGALKTYSDNVPDAAGKLSEASGTLVSAMHSKALPVSELVLTPHGWVAAGSLAAGDVVVAGDGSSCRIRVRHNAKAPHQVWAVRTVDGAECRADAGHLWMTARGLRCTKELLPGDRLPLTPAYDGWEQPVGDPYVLGTLLGDGFLPGMFVTTADAAVRDEVLSRVLGSARSRRTPGGREVWDVVVRSQEEFVLSLGLAGLTKQDKFLPDSVWAWSAADRLALLQGLMDTDGTVGYRSNAAAFVNASEKLVRGVQQLVWSLGGTCRVGAYQSRAGGRAYGPYYQARLRLRSNPFLLPRKRDKQAPKLVSRQSFKREVLSVVRTGASEPVVCYTIDHSSGLFIAGDFLVTHNCYWAGRRRAERAQASDPGNQPAQTADWRDPETVSVEELLAAHDGDRGG